MRKQAAELGLGERVQFLGGRRSDVPRLLAAADVFCQPNRESEGFSLAFMEACAAGLPIVTSALGGALEMVSDENGFLTAVEDVPAVTAALRTLLEQPEVRRRKGEAGRRRVEEQCDPGRQLARYQGLVRGFGGSRRGADEFEAAGMRRRGGGRVLNGGDFEVATPNAQRRRPACPPRTLAAVRFRRTRAPRLRREGLVGAGGGVGGAAVAGRESALASDEPAGATEEFVAEEDPGAVEGGEGDVGAVDEEDVAVGEPGEAEDLEAEAAHAVERGLGLGGLFGSRK